MKIIAVIGKKDSKKSEFSGLLTEYFTNSFGKKIFNIDVDTIVQNILADASIVEELKSKLGNSIVDENGKVVVEKLDKLALINQEQLKNTILLYLKKKLNQIILQNIKTDYIIFESSLHLFISPLFKSCHYKILIGDDIKENMLVGCDTPFITYDTIVDDKENKEVMFNMKAYATCFHLIQLHQNENVAYYPGSFDPITYGHIDVIKKTLKLGFDKVIIAVANNSSKQSTMFTAEERVEMIREVFKYNPKIEAIIVSPTKASVRIAEDYNCSALIRGFRNVTDFEYELTLSKVNASISSVETLFLTASQKYDFVSSSSTKELAYLNEDISAYVPPHIQKCVIEKMKKN